MRVLSKHRISSVPLFQSNTSPMNTTQVVTLFSATLLLSASCGPVFASGITNNFDTAADYVANGILGDTNWDGVYLGFGDIQNGNPGGSGNGATLAATVPARSGHRPRQEPRRQPSGGRSPRRQPAPRRPRQRVRSCRVGPRPHPRSRRRCRQQVRG